MSRFNRITALLLAAILLLNTVGLPVYAEVRSARPKRMSVAVSYTHLTLPTKA